MMTNSIVRSLVRATSTISRSSSTTATPLQRTIIQSRRYQQYTSVRYILFILSAIYLIGCISYCCYIIIATYHFHPYPFIQKELSSSSSSTTKYFRDSNDRRVHVFYWDNDDLENETQVEQMQHSKIGSSTTQLSTASFASKSYYPWNMFTSNVKGGSYNHNNENALQDATKQQLPQHGPESISKNKDEYDDDSSGSNNNNDDSDDDDTMQQPSLAHHVQQQKKKNDQQSTPTDNTNSNARTDKNPAIYGWTPNQYPNPIVDPVHCAVSYILPHLQQEQRLSPPGINDEVVASTAPISPTDNINTNSTLSKKDDIVLRLCDPDWVLGGIYLEDVAMALYNFSTLFGSHSHEENHVDEQSDNGDESKNPSSSETVTMESPTTTNNDPQSSKEEDWNIEVGPSNRRRRSLRSDVYLSSTSTFFHDSSSEAFRRRTQSSTPASDVPRIELAVATVRKMNIPLVLRQGNANNNNYNGNNYYSTYENDDDDLVNDAAQIFARTLHDDWWSSMDTAASANGTGEGDWYMQSIESHDDSTDGNPADYGILLFLSVQDRVCFISTGSSISVNILPWWRLDHIVTNMKPYLQNRNYGIAILHAIHDISNMLLNGPPTLSDRIHDFVSRFGIVIAFAAFTFCFGAWGEYRDRRKRWQHAEQRSKLTSVERQKAQQLQMEFRSRCCPICLENYDYGDSLPSDMEDQDEYSIPITGTMGKPVLSTNSLISLLGDPRKGVVDEYGIPRRGADGRKIKLLRCGHIFCETCWRSWVHSTACGSPCSCPVCRQDVGKTLSRNRRSQSVPVIATTIPSDSSQSGMATSSTSNDGTEYNVTRTTISRNAQSYDSFAEHNRPTSSTARVVRVNTMLRGAILFRQTSAVANRSSEYIVESNNNNDSHSQSDENSPLLSI